MFKVGDYVKIVDNLRSIYYGPNYYALMYDMLQYAGKITKIKNILQRGEKNAYYLEIDNQAYFWYEPLLESVNKNFKYLKGDDD